MLVAFVVARSSVDSSASVGEVGMLASSDGAAGVVVVIAVEESFLS